MGKRFAIFVYICLSPVLVIVEEVIMSVSFFLAEMELVKILDFDLTFDELASNVQDQLRKYYDALGENQARRSVVMAREASIQLVLQNALIRVEHVVTG